jgi:hypothetical protein
MRALQVILEDNYGLDLSGWTLTDARGISADGSTIAGFGLNPSGNREAYVAYLPEPGGSLLTSSALLALAVFRRRGRADRLSRPS